MVGVELVDGERDGGDESERLALDESRIGEDRQAIQRRAIEVGDAILANHSKGLVRQEGDREPKSVEGRGRDEISRELRSKEDVGKEERTSRTLDDDAADVRGWDRRLVADSDCGARLDWIDEEGPVVGDVMGGARVGGEELFKTSRGTRGEEGNAARLDQQDICMNLSREM